MHFIDPLFLCDRFCFFSFLIGYEVMSPSSMVITIDSNISTDGRFSAMGPWYKNNIYKGITVINCEIVINLVLTVTHVALLR